MVFALESKVKIYDDKQNLPLHQKPRSTRMLPIVLISAVALLAHLLYKYILYPGFISPFSKVPRAHYSVAFTSIWIRWKRPEGTNAIQTILAAHKNHGPIVRLSPDELSVASLDGLRRRCWGRNPFPLSDYFMIFS
jgi:hypothetical protein